MVEHLILKGDDGPSFCILEKALFSFFRGKIEVVGRSSVAMEVLILQRGLNRKICILPTRVAENYRAKNSKAAFV